MYAINNSSFIVVAYTINTITWSIYTKGKYGNLVVVKNKQDGTWMMGASARQFPCTEAQAISTLDMYNVQMGR